MRDPYDVLGVARTASPDDIKKAFRRLAKKYHPDQNQDAPHAKEAFAEINSAYEILGDTAKKGQFDRGEIDAEGKPKFTGAHGFDFRGGGGPFGGAGAGAGPRGGARGGEFDDFLTDILGQAFGGGARGGFRAGPGGPGGMGGMGGGGMGGGPGGGGARARPRGEDVEVTAHVELEDVARGDKIRVELPTGRTLEVALPEGVLDRQQIRLKGQGQPGAGGAGDAIVTVAFEHHPLFHVDGHDLETDAPISLEDAVLGGKVRVTTLEGAVELNLPAGTTGGKALRLKGKGLPTKTGTRGNLYVKPRIILPDTGDAELEAFLKARKAR